MDEVAKYRVYTDAGEKGGEYVKIFEEEYKKALNELKQDMFLNEGYNNYLDNIPVNQTHNGYFSMDKKGKMVNALKSAKIEREESTDQSAYDLILKDKERLLSFEEPTRFIFSHSALREGWDNPNVFVICTLKHSNSTISRRQEVGRGLRIAVNQLGERQDDPATVHQTNVLTVVASESYKDFVSALQKDISESLSERPRAADEAYFTGKVMRIGGEAFEVSPPPVGNYNPDWAISFKEGSVKHIYFVAETKGSMSTMELRGIEKTKIECARKFFDEINRKINPKNVKYDVVDTYGKLMDLVNLETVIEEN